jgi:hypothetical protein
MNFHRKMIIQAGKNNVIRRIGDYLFTCVLMLLLLTAGAGCSGGDAPAPATTSSGTTSTTTPSDVTVSSIAVMAGSTTIVANATDHTVLRATVLDDDGAPVVGTAVSFSTTAGLLSAASATTNANGIAQVDLTAGTQAGSATATATASGFNQSVNVSFVPGPVGNVALVAAPATVNSTGTSSVSATITDANSNIIAGESVTFAFTAQGSGAPTLSEITAVTNTNGVVSVSYIAGNSAGIDTISATTSNAVTDSVSITVDVTAAKIGALALITANSEIIADGVSRSQIGATLTTTDNSPVVGATVIFASTGGTLENLAGAGSTTATTDTLGHAELYLKSGTNPATVLVTADSGGYSDTVTVLFTPGEPLIANSSITASPTSIPADGASTTEVTVLLVDANSNLVSDGTMVTLSTSAGTITSPTSEATVSGRATFTVKAPNGTATATLSLLEYPGITGNIVFGTTGTGEPANITPIVGDQFLSISGVGKLESTSISIVVYDDEGSPIQNPTSLTANNIKVTFASQPNGGEFISGVNASGNIDNSLDATYSALGEILVRTVDGAVTINLQTGTLPGVIELRIEALLKNDGVTPLSPVIVAQIPQISVASGPPHTIALSTPITNSVENLGDSGHGAFYRRKGTLIVTDRFGNAVADGTTINLGIMDSVIVEGSDGDLTASVSTLSSLAPELSSGIATSFDTASVTRNNAQRFVQENDRVLITDTNILQEDKVRFVGTGILSTQLPVQTAYLTSSSNLSYINLDYVVGSARLGAEIAGYDADTDTLTTGSVTTVDGLADVRVTYPANSNTIHVGCGVQNDTRHDPMNSAMVVYTVATSTSGDAAMVEDSGKLCFASIAPWTIVPAPSAISGAGTVTLTVYDGGDGFSLPFIPIGATVLITKGDSLTVNATTGISNASGNFTSVISTTGAQTGDAATITYWADGYTTDVSLTFAGAIAPWTLTADTTDITGSDSVLLTVTDGGVPLFAAITKEVTILNDPGDDLTINVSEGSTDSSGEFTSVITVVTTGADTGDQAIITFTAGTVTVDVLLTIP